MDMHRVSATTPGDSGWYLGESNLGSFSVLMPIPFNDFTVSANDPKAGIVKIHCIGGQSADGMKFSAVETPLIREQASPDLDQMPIALATEGQNVTDIDKAAFLGCPSVSFSINSVASGAYVRYVLTRSNLIVLTLEYPVSHRAEAAMLKHRFLNSLKLKGPNEPASIDGAIKSP